MSIPSRGPLRGLKTPMNLMSLTQYLTNRHLLNYHNHSRPNFSGRRLGFSRYLVRRFEDDLHEFGLR
jgi:hypothetical protein